MATDLSFVEFVAEQARLGPRLTWRKMFGEYGLYVDAKVVAFACDDSLFVKPTAATAPLTADLPQRPPYPGAKNYPVADEWLDDPDRLRDLLLATCAAVPQPKPKAKAKPKAKTPRGRGTPKKK
jgi:TfoX/Sxy family transcriptional regulator of competence genes